VAVKVARHQLERYQAQGNLIKIINRRQWRYQQQLVDITQDSVIDGSDLRDVSRALAQLPENSKSRSRRFIANDLYDDIWSMKQNFFSLRRDDCGDGAFAH
jgi:hypothetical protein